MTLQQPTRSLTLAALAVGIVVLVFFDVVFLRASLQPSNISPQIAPLANWRYHALLPQLNPAAMPGFGYGDLGASAWQSEPARYLMARDFREHESPFWNPYSASGTVGPETLVDIKFSPLTLLSAYFFNASPGSFDYSLVLLYCSGAFFALLLLHHCLRLPLLASSAGVVIYLLNGFATPNLNSHMGQPYFFFPLLLYSLLMFSERQTVWRWIGVVLSHALLLLVTFLPTLVMVFISCHLLNMAFLLSNNSNWKDRLRSLALAGGASLVALALDGFLWLPILASFHTTDMLTDFNARPLQHPHHLNNLLSLFTPKHFWENNSQVLHADLYPRAKLNRHEIVIPYMGIFAALVASYAFHKQTLARNPFMLCSAILLVISCAYIFGFVPFISHIPILRTIGKQYWGAMGAIALMILVPQGLQNIRNKVITTIPAVVVLGLLAWGYIKLLKKLDSPTLEPYLTYTHIIVALFGLCCVLLVWLATKQYRGNLFAAVLLALVVAELLFYLNTVRPLRFDPVAKTPAFIEFLHNHAGESRVINVGQSFSLLPEYGAMFGVRQVDTQNPGLLPWYRDFYKTHFGTDTTFFLTLGYQAEIDQPILEDRVIDETALQVADVNYILVVDGAARYQEFFRAHHYPEVFHQDGLMIFENPRHPEFAALVPALLQASTLPAGNNFNPALTATSDDEALLGAARQLGIPVLEAPVPALHAVVGTATVAARHNTEILVDTDAAQPALLALSETWHPDWQATVDGQPAYVGRINEAFRGVALPAGHHQVRFRYNPPALRHGIALSALTALALAGLAFVSMRRGPR